jgi:hypothetical protein
MNIEIYINGKKIHFFINFGWYKGNDFSLLRLEFFHKPNNVDSIWIIDFNVIKLSFVLGLDWNYD